MKTQFNLKAWFEKGSIWSLGRRPTIVYAHVTDQEPSIFPRPSTYQDNDSEKGTESTPTYQKSRSRASLLAIMIFTIITMIQSIMLFKQRSTHLMPFSPIPDFPFNLTSFERQLDWEFSPQAHDLWRSVLPASGLIAIKHPEKYNLKHGLETSAEDSEVYGVQVTHEYHCLNMMRENFYGLVIRDEKYMKDLYASDPSEDLPQGTLSHVFHCYDYLRQTILCRSDMTIEWRSKVNPMHIDGYGPPRTCRNWDQVYEWMVANLPPDDVFHMPQ